MSRIVQIINEEIDNLHSANFPEFGERLHNLDEYGEANLPPYDFNIEDLGYDQVNYNFDTEDGDEYVVMFNQFDRIKRIWDLQFGVVDGTPTDVVNRGRRDRVMSTLVKIVNAFIDKYKEVGGTPWLDFHHTVFGKITDGTDVLEDIAATRTGMGDKPVYDVVIETIEIEE